MIDVVPACIPKKFEDITEKISAVKDLVPLVQVDVADGAFTPAKTWPYNKDADDNFERIKGEDEGLPFWESVDYEIDLLVRKPEEKIDDWIRAGISSAVVHFESTDRLEMVIEKARYFDIKIGLALSPATPNEAIYEWMDEIDFVQFMGNDKIGYNGVELDKKVLKKIREMRDTFPESVLAIDIGVNESTAPDLVDAGVTKLISGSAIFESGDIEGTIDYFQNL